MADDPNQLDFLNLLGTIKVLDGQTKDSKSPYVTNDNIPNSTDISVAESLKALSSDVKEIIKILLEKNSNIESTTTVEGDTNSSVTNIVNTPATDEAKLSITNQTGFKAIYSQFKQFFERKQVPDNRDISATLNSNERTRYRAIFTILGEVLEIGRFDKGPEAKRLITPSALPSTTSNIPATPVADRVKSIDQLKREDFLTNLLSGIGIAGLLYQFLTGNFAGMMQTLYRTLKVAANTAVQAILKFLEPFKNSIKPIALVIGNSLARLFTVFSDIFTGMVKFLKESTFTKKIIDVFDNLISSVGNFFTGIKDAITRKITDLTGSLEGMLPSFMLPKTPAASPTAPGSSPLPATGPTSTPPPTRVTPLPSTAPTLPSTSLQPATGFKATAKKVLSTLADPVKAAVGKLYSNMGGARGILKGVGKVIKPLAGKVPIVGSLIEMFFGKGDIEKLKKRRETGDIATDDELHFLAGQRVIKGLGGLFGGAVGATVVGLLTGPTGPFAILGALAGGAMGDITGRLLAEYMTNNLIPTSATREVGQIVVSGMKEEELQDFIVKNGQVYKFNNKDEVLGMKEGGAIGNLISSIVTNNNKYYSIASRQVKVLEEIRDGIKVLINKSPSSATTTTPGNSRNPQPVFSTFNLRSDFDSMNNIATI